MIPYWVLFAIVAFFALARFEHGEPDSANRRGLLLAAVLITLMIGLRFSVGGDWGSYLKQFVFYAKGGYSSRSDDIGYVIVNKAVAAVGGGIWAVNLICAAIFSTGLYLLLRRQPNPWLGLLVSIAYLVIVVAMGYTRQSVAIGFVMGGLATFDRRHLGRFCLWMLAAIAFHKSAIIMLPLTLIAVSENRFLTYILGAFLTAAAYYAFAAASADRFVGNYVVQRMDSTGAVVRTGVGALAAVLYLIQRRQLRFTEDQSAVWRNIAVAAIAALAASAGGVPSTAVDRLALYALPLQIVVTTRLTAFALATRNSARQATLAIIGLYGLLLYVWLNFGNYSRYWIPYHFYPFQ